MSRFRDNGSQLTETNTVLLGVSVDSVWANKAFREQLGMEFPILSDTKRELSKQLGIYDETNDVARRTTFVIDTSGAVRHIDQQRDAVAHAEGAIGVCRLMKKGTGQ
jgi:peroxiredoxin (alkyl hydroperoxide reductase subunit C)